LAREISFGFGFTGFQYYKHNNLSVADAKREKKKTNKQTNKQTNMLAQVTFDFGSIFDWMTKGHDNFKPFVMLSKCEYFRLTSEDLRIRIIQLFLLVGGRRRLPFQRQISC